MLNKVVKIAYSTVNIIASIAAKRVKNPFDFVSAEYGRGLMKRMHASDAKISAHLGNDEESVNEFYRQTTRLDKYQSVSMEEDGIVLKENKKHKIKTKAEVVQFIIIVVGVMNGMNMSNIIVHITAMLYRLMTKDNKISNMVKLLLILQHPIQYIFDILVFWAAVFKYKVDEELVSIILTGIGLLTYR